MKKNFLLIAIFISIAVATTSIFSEKPIILAAVLVACLVIKHKILPIKKEFIWFIVSGFLGTIGESLIVNVSGAWTYPNTPYWLPFLWGYVGVMGISLYKILTGSSR